ncbi:FAD-dependent oxidoreductase [Streptomyces sp. KL116D]|uniref:FAD-dependent oxidoreductase n=1 Tax=Streptomyces sp. KL116D TaxID=3045152 RepID=UPI003555E598
MKVVVVGGVAGGMSAATRLRRLDEQAEIVVLERGAHVSYANCGLPYFLGGVIEGRDALLVQTPEALHARFRIDVRVRHEAVAVDRDARTVRVRDLVTGEECTESFDRLVLNPGARPFVPQLPGVERAFTLRDVSDTDRIAAEPTAGARTAAVAGAGFICVGVRTAAEHGRGAIPGALNIPLDELRERAAELPDGDLVVHCQVGLRGHTALRLLAGLGRDAANLDGGFATWSAGQAA